MTPGVRGGACAGRTPCSKPEAVAGGSKQLETLTNLVDKTNCRGLLRDLKDFRTETLKSLVSTIAAGQDRQSTMNGY